MEDLKKINEKSIDIYVFIQALTGKRMGLNKVSEALVGVSKTLASWAEWEVLRKKYLETKDETILETLKQYCKNDVRMTMLVFLYLMHFKKLFIEGEEITFTLEELEQKSHQEIKETSHMVGQNMFEN